MSLEDGMFVNIKTYNKSYNPDERGDFRPVHLYLDRRAGRVFLSGGIDHMAEIVIDQALVDDLQEVVNFLKARRAEVK